ncbi:MAG: hypothetical protein QUU85_08710, partial [Candidatus Eisenbacteria bacterium]|nr:hypothetical protein [Candidatus Eisenbacteria bacterium]
MRPLEKRHLRELGERALQDGERGLGAAQLALDEAGWSVLLRHAALDARRLLNTLEMLASATRPDASGARRPTAEWVARVCERQGRSPVGPEEHFDLISALHKSLRGSDPHASLYWLARLLEGGEDPRYVLRRLLRFASEDVGLADPSALHHATAAAAAYQWVGSPEGHLAIAQLVLHLALCPKSNSVYMSYERAASLVADRGPLPVPLRIRNAPTRLMEGLGYGAGYRYPHESPGHWIPESYLPDGIPESDRILYRSSRQGREADLVESHRKRTHGFYEGTLTGAEASEGREASEPAGGAEGPAVDGPPRAAGEPPEA